MRDRFCCGVQFCEALWALVMDNLIQIQVVACCFFFIAIARSIGIASCLCFKLLEVSRDFVMMDFCFVALVAFLLASNLKPLGLVEPLCGQA